MKPTERPSEYLKGMLAKTGGRYQPPSVLKKIFGIPCYVGLLPSFLSTLLQQTTGEIGGDTFLFLEKSASSRYSILVWSLFSDVKGTDLDLIEVISRHLLEGNEETRLSMSRAGSKPGTFLA
jgi:hypothetical protein